MKTLAEINNIQLLVFKDGTEEAELYNTKEYRQIELSSNRKTHVIHEFLILSLEDKLLTNKDQNAEFHKSNVQFSPNVLQLINDSKIELRLKETWKCYESHCFEAASILLRKILEFSIHLAFKRTEGNDNKLKDKKGVQYLSLPSKIDILQQNNLISSTLANSVKGYTKFFGDLAAHDISITITKNEFELANSTLGKALEHVFQKVDDIIKQKKTIL